MNLKRDITRLCKEQFNKKKQATQLKACLNDQERHFSKDMQMINSTQKEAPTISYQWNAIILYSNYIDYNK